MTNPIGAIFGRSPIRPLEGHMGKAKACVDLLGDIITASAQEDWDRVEELHASLMETKSDADEIKRDIRTHLPTSLFLPVARSDLLELLRIQDDITFRCKDAATMVLIRKMVIPQELLAPSTAFFESTQSITRQAQTVINELDELLETGFRGKEADFVATLISRLDEMESSNEKTEFELLREVVKQEQSMPPVDAIFLYKFIDCIGSIAHSARKAGSRLLVLMAS